MPYYGEDLPEGPNKKPLVKVQPLLEQYLGRVSFNTGFNLLNYSSIL